MVTVVNHHSHIKAPYGNGALLKKIWRRSGGPRQGVVTTNASVEPFATRIKHTHTHMHAHTNIQTQAHMHMHTHTYVQTHTCTHIHIHAHTNTYTSTYTHTHMHRKTVLYLSYKGQEHLINLNTVM